MRCPSCVAVVQMVVVEPGERTLTLDIYRKNISMSITQLSAALVVVFLSQKRKKIVCPECVRIRSEPQVMAPLKIVF